MSIFETGNRWQVSGVGKSVVAAFCLAAIWHGLPSADCSPPAAALYEVREIKPRVFVWLPEDVLDQDGDPEFARAGTASFILTADGVMVIDTTNSPFHAREVLYEIRKRTDAPVKYVIDTSSEGDVALGNEAFVDDQPAILSSPATQFEMRLYKAGLARRVDGDWRLEARMRGFHPTPPNQTFEGGTTLRLGGEEVRLTAFSTGPPTGPATADTAAYLPAEKVAFLGGLFSPAYFPRLASTERTRDLRRWIGALVQVEAWDADVYVPGHGAPGSRRDVAEFRQFLEWLTNEVGTRVKEGKSLAQTKQELEPALENRHWHAPELGAEVIEDAYRQVSAAHSSVNVPARPSR